MGAKGGMKMKLRQILPALALGLLCACGSPGGSGPVPTPAPESAPPETAAPAPTAPALPEGELGFTVLPVGEESIRTLYRWEGYGVEKITPWEGDFLVEYDYGMLDWVFGSTGRRVRLVSASDEVASYRILDRGRVEVTTTGWSQVTPWQGLPETYECAVLGDENGYLDPSRWNYDAHTESRASVIWLDPAQALNYGLEFNEEEASPGRFEQIYDARVGVNDLSVAFIPSGADVERFMSFFPAVCTVPSVAISCDAESRVMTVRLRNTALASGGATEEEIAQMLEWIGPDSPYAGLYPHSFPTGSLGRDNHFFAGASIAQDGEDAVITLRLTGRAYRYTVESGDFMEDGIPYLRLTFRERVSWLDGE